MSNDKSKMKLGIQPTGWTNDDFQEIGNDTPYQVILDQTRDAGFEGGSTGHNYPTHLPSLLQDLKSRNLKIVSTWAGTSFTTGVNEDAAFAAFEAQDTFLEEVSAQDVVVAELANAVNQLRVKSVLTDRPILNEPQWFLLTHFLDLAGKYAKERGMQLSYHPHVGTCVMTVEETERLLDSTNSEYVGLCLDTAHICLGGASQKQLVDLTRKYATRITHVHLKNVRKAVLDKAVKENYSFYQAIESGIFTVPGDTAGEMAINLDPIMDILKSVGYDRWLVIEAEQDPGNPDPYTNKYITPLEYAKMARKFLSKHLGY
jgi:inosose dehydratase